MKKISFSLLLVSFVFLISHGVAQAACYGSYTCYAKAARYCSNDSNKECTSNNNCRDDFNPTATCGATELRFPSTRSCSDFEDPWAGNACGNQTISFCKGVDGTSACQSSVSCPAGQSYCSGCGCKDTTTFNCSQWIANSCNAPVVNPCASTTTVTANWCNVWMCGNNPCVKLATYQLGSDGVTNCGGYNCQTDTTCAGCAFCGDGACNGTEVCWNGSSGCPDCGNCCGNDLRTNPRNICQPTRGETCYNTQTGTGCSDCGTCAYCGDGNQDPGELCSNIPNNRDFPAQVCEPDMGICEPFCGDEACNGFEGCYNKYTGNGCQADCGECSYTWL